MKENEGKKIIITGPSSFVGAHLAVYFAKKGFEVVAIVLHEHDKLTIPGQRIDWVISHDVKIVKCDLTVENVLAELIANIKPNYFIHHAGWTKQYSSLDYDLMTSLKIHVTPLKNMIAALAQHGCQGLLITGTNSEYKNSKTAHKEEEACWPSTPYGLSKLVQTVHACQLAEIFHLPTRVARLFIPYGLYDTPEKLIPSAIDHLRRNKPIELTSCNQINDCVYIDDVMTAYDILLKTCSSPPVFDIYNISTNSPVVLRDFLLYLASVMKVDSQLLAFGTKQKRALASESCYGDNHKLLALGWKPLSMQEGILCYLAEIKGGHYE